jgi:hypothetical protein
MSEFNVRDFLGLNRAERRRKLVFRCSTSAVAAGAVLCAVWGFSDWSCHRVQAARSSAPSGELQGRSITLDPAGPVLLRPTISPFELTGEEPAGPEQCKRLISPDAVRGGWLSLVLQGAEQMQMLFTHMSTQGLRRPKE